MAAPQSPSPELIALQEALAGRFFIEREIGRGGMGVVYLSQEVALDRPVALKVLPPALAAQPALRERFLREARTAARLSHPHIVPIHLVEEAGDIVFFVMSFIEGQTLGQRVRERGPIAPREATRILREVAWALAYAHGQGVVHRDIKPDNILLEAGSGRALVTDFGIARAGADPGLTGVGEIVGTPEYMSPEQAGGEAVDGRSDVYAVGVVAHFMLSGRTPFEGQTVQATLARQLTQPAPGLVSVAPEVPVPLAEAVDRCLAKEPAERIQGGEELAEILGRVLQERREVPAAIRLFQEQQRESQGALGVLAMMFLVVFAIALVLVDEAGLAALVSALPGLAAVTLWLTVPAGLLIGMARRLLKAGYDHDDLVRALERDVDDRRRELAPEVGEKSALEVWAPRVGWVGILAFTLGALALLVPSIPIALIENVVLAATVLTAGGVLTSAVLLGLRQTAPGARWLRFWDSAVGSGVFTLAGIGLEQGQAAAGSYRPTELAIGMAAERLFEELPKPVRKSLGDVPGVLAMLEGHAESMRARIRELDRVLLEVAPEDPAASVDRHGMPGKRDAVANEVRHARDAASARLRKVVASLEGLRLELLRLHAGSGDVASLTLDIAAASALAADVSHRAEGLREVNEMLGSPAGLPEPADTPQRA